MKTVLIIFLLSLNIFASTLEKNYDDLNTQLDKLAINLTPEEKVSLFYPILSTHEKIITSLSINEIKIQDLNNLEQETLKIISKLRKDNDKLNIKQLDNVKKLYLQMKNNGINLIETNSKEPINNTSSIVIFIFCVLTLFIGFIIGYFIFYNAHIKKMKKDTSKFIIEDLQNYNTNLLYKLETLKKSEDLNNEEQNTKLKDENKFLKETLLALQNELNRTKLD
ncbi:MAG: hypothetical protein K8R44_04995 [Sulfurimonas sp.]|nr:hypothetical protein [Sulfurimonas sp.]